MEFDKHFKIKPKITLSSDKFNTRDEMDKAVRRLELTMVKPMQSNFIRKPEEEARIAKQQYDQTLTQINLAQQRYMERLEQAKEAGAIDNAGYIKAAEMDISDPFSSFGRMRRNAEEAYRKVVKFDL